jgi:hypothetical protein
MKKVLTKKDMYKNHEYLSDIPECDPIFAVRNGKLEGMIVQEEKGWILRIGGPYGSTGFHPTRSELLESEFSMEYGYDFYVEE